MSSSDDRISMTYRPNRDVYKKLRDMAYRLEWSHERFINTAVKELIHRLDSDPSLQQSLKDSD